MSKKQKAKGESRPETEEEFTAREKTIFFYCNTKGNIKDLEKVQDFPAGTTSAQIQAAFDEWLKANMDIGWVEYGKPVKQ